LDFGKNLAAALVMWGLGATAILVWQIQSPIFHTILDTSAFLTSGLIALLLWDVSRRSGEPLARFLAISFGVVAAAELVHVLIALEKLSWESPAEAEIRWRAGTWGPSAYLSAIGVGTALFLRSRPLRLGWTLALALILFYAALFVTFQLLPRYYLPGFFGISRPSLIGVPLLWAAVAFGYWRLQKNSQVARAVAAGAVVMALAHCFMLFSQPADDPTAIVGTGMVAHFGKVVADILLLLSLTQIGAADTVRRLRAEAELTRINTSLEQRVRERTAALETTNSGLQEQIALRQEADHKLQAQLERLNLLNRITRSIGERQDLRSIFQVAIRNLEDRLPADFVCILFHDAATGSLTVGHVGSKSADLAPALGMPERAQITVDENGLSRCLEGQLVYEPRLHELKFPFPSRLAKAGLGALVISPLTVEKEVIGVLAVSRRGPDSFSSADCEFQRQLSEQIALAWHHAQLYDNLLKAYEDLRLTQAAAAQQDRLRVLGQMASGIAHDINNAVSPLSLHTASLIERETGLSDQMQAYLGTVQRVTNDVAATIARLREFYREREPESAMQPVDLNALVRQTVDLTRARWSDMPQQRGNTISVRQELDPGLPPVMGYDSELREALTNLIFNAVDALPQGGEILLRTATVAATPPRVILEVRDNGAGMDEKTVQRCMEPFFTTKGERGTGLGLAMVSGTAKRHAAGIVIDSAPGKGTTLRLEFSRTALPDAAAPAAKITSAPQPMRLLIIDDDPFVLDSMRMVLELDGHTVVTAGGGKEGVNVFRQARDQNLMFTAVITDLGMPDMNGNQVAGAIKAMSPATPVILLTGWGQRLRQENDQAGENDRNVNMVLSKPPQLDELRAALVQLS
jgi:signal transduction histidine kinase/ActR/RegA family two-component response regulator